MAPGPIVGASDPEEVEGAPLGGAEAAEAAQNPTKRPKEELGDPLGLHEGEVHPQKATTASRFVYAYSLVALVDKAEEEERERIYRERAEERAKGKGGKGDKGAEANGKAEGRGMRGTQSPLEERRSTSTKERQESQGQRNRKERKREARS